jgi:hypothetical protein
MNTSNKILAGFILLVFLVPVFVLLSFKSKVRSGQFTEVKNEQYKSANFRDGNFQPYKVVKLISPEGRALKCNLQYSDSLYYSYNVNNSRDSVRVYNLADTLFIQYITRTTSTKDNTDVYSPDELYVDVKLPSIEQLVVNNAEVTIANMNTEAGKSMLVEVYGTGLLKLGSTPGDNRGIMTDNKDLYTIDQLFFKSANGEISLGNNVSIGQLTINAEGTSTVTIKDGASIESVQGNLSDSSTVNASWKYVKKLAGLSNN